VAGDSETSTGLKCPIANVIIAGNIDEHEHITTMDG
jgi:hypothetical protein